MLYRTKFLSRRFNLSLWVLSTFFLFCANAKADNGFDKLPSPNKCTNTYESVNGDSSLPLLPKSNFYKRKPHNVTIYQYDNSLLGKRSPLLIVHGLRAEYCPYFRWEKVVKRLQSNKDFASKFKIYLARYDSTAPLDKIVPLMQKKIAGLYQATEQKPIVALALSIGGNVLYESMLNPETDKQIRLLMTMGTPFHGSPLFSADWLKYGLYKNLSFPWMRMDRAVAYKLYFARNPNLLLDLQWDNCDGAIPTVGPYHSHLPLGPSGDLNPATSINPRMVAINKRNFDKSKLITYSGYLLNPYQLPEKARVFETTILAPYTVLTILLPAHLAREHPVLKMLNQVIATVPATETASKRDKTNFVYVLNDGITPVMSSMFLPDQYCATQGLSREADLIKIKPYIDVHTARIFRNIDHLTYIDGSRPAIVIPNVMRDELNPQAGSKDIFSWILFDLDCVADEGVVAQSQDT